jgi:glyoxylase-like metal-dependent hydrolase (beta-lactamase superfamily II)
MWVKEPGTITERIEFLGRSELCSYLVKGDTYALLGGAMAHVIPDVLTQLNNLEVDLERIRHLIILHSHYDHLGMAPYLARKWPWLTVAISKVGARILKNQKALKVIQGYNNSMVKTAHGTDQIEPLNCVKECFPIHRIINGGMELDLGNRVKLQIIDAPGHSVCSIAAYFPREYALFPSDSIGSLTEERILPMGSSNYDDFQDSIEKLSNVNAEIVCLEHFGALTPPEGIEFCERVKKEAKGFRKEMIDTFKREGDIELTIEKLAKDFDCGLSKVGLLPEDLLKDILKRMVKFVNKIE